MITIDFTTNRMSIARRMERFTKGVTVNLCDELDIQLVHTLWRLMPDAYRTSLLNGKEPWNDPH